jgi:ABC-type microcin C transport system permease subunit YejB
MVRYVQRRLLLLIPTLLGTLTALSLPCVWCQET